MRDEITGEYIALEVKYLGPDERGVRDVDRMIKFINDKDIAQARKYLDKFKGGLLWVVNHEEMVYKYDYLFHRDGLSRFRIVYIQSK